MPLVVEEKSGVDSAGTGGPAPSPSLDLNDNEDLPTELSDSSETHDEGTKLKLFIRTLLDSHFSSLCFLEFQVSVCVSSSISATDGALDVCTYIYLMS